MCGLLDDKYLYHYTKLESASKIIESRKIRFGNIKLVNDINESSGPIYFQPKEYKSNLDDILKNYRFISFTRDGEKHGFDIPAMWGHYAERGKGVCLVINKKKLLSQLDDAIYTHDMYYSNTYDHDERYLDPSKYVSPTDFICNTKDELFFHKTLDWSYEQEFRLAVISDEIGEIDVAGSLEGVIVFAPSQKDFLESFQYKQLKKIKEKLFLYRYCTTLGKWDLFDENGASLKPTPTIDMTATRGIIEL